jgi:hypothetical protein
MENGETALCRTKALIDWIEAYACGLIFQSGVVTKSCKKVKPPAFYNWWFKNLVCF